MSRLVEIEQSIYDIESFKRIAIKLGYTVSEGSVTFYSGQKVDGTLIKIPGWKYPVVVDKNGKVHYDCYNGRWGEKDRLLKLTQKYSVEELKMHCASIGKPFVEVFNEKDQCIDLIVGGYY